MQFALYGMFGKSVRYYECYIIFCIALYAFSKLEIMIKENCHSVVPLFCQTGCSAGSFWKSRKPGSERNNWWMYEDQH